MKKYLWFTFIVGLLAACNKDSDFENFNSSNFKITYTGQSTFIADDTSRLVVHIQTLGSQNGDAITTSFPSAAGILFGTDGSNKVYLQNDTASFVIQANNVPGDYLLNFQFNSNVRSFQQVHVNIGTSYPDTLLVDASKTLLDTTATTTFTVTLKKLHGKVSSTLGISANAYQLKGNQQVIVGRFTGLSPNVVNATSQVILTYFCDTGGFDKSLPVYFSFTSRNDAGQAIQTIVVLKFKS